MKWTFFAASLAKRYKVKATKTQPLVGRIINKVCWDNVHTWLKRVHERSVCAWYLPPSQQRSKSRKDVLVLSGMFHTVTSLRSQSWDTLELLLAEQYVVLTAIDPRWAQDP